VLAVGPNERWPGGGVADHPSLLGRAQWRAQVVGCGPGAEAATQWCPTTTPAKQENLALGQQPPQQQREWQRQQA
jgi:hypothetical protein